MIRPEIIILSRDASCRVLKEILAGIEEECVLYKVIEDDGKEDGHLLGQMASEMSQLEVGIGIDGSQASVWIKKIRNAPLFMTTIYYRRLGQNAARYVKGNPLIEL